MSLLPVIQDLERRQIDAVTAQRRVPEFAPGDTVKVMVKVMEDAEADAKAKGKGKAAAKPKDEDKGPGFKPEAVPDPTLDENLTIPTGRGLLLMRAYMAKVEYVGRGNRVEMVYQRPKTTGA